MGLRKPTFFRRILAGVLTLACVLFFPFAFTMAADDGTLQIVAFGDSLTQGYGLPPNQAFPVQLEAALRTKGVLAAVFNAGVSGETSEDGLARIHHVLAVQPQIVILEFGANDVFAQFEPEETYVNLDRILTILRAKKSGSCWPVAAYRRLPARSMTRNSTPSFHGLRKNTGCRFTPSFSKASREMRN